MIIGSGAREHCIAWKISKSPLVDKIFTIPGNPGTEEIGDNKSIGIDSEDFDELINFAKQEKIDLTIVGPEAPLVDGIVDRFRKDGLKIFGPDKKSAVIEGSKVYTKKFCRKYNIPSADFEVYNISQKQEAIEKINSIADDGFPIVIKADGLAAGKGVLIVDSKNQAKEAIDSMFVEKVFGEAGNNLIIEDFLTGYEVSILSLCDGEYLKPLVLAQDYKRIFDDDKGKNTGGMGSYSPVPLVDKKTYNRILEEIIYPTYGGLKQEGIDYKGILYGGILVSKGDPYLLEYNCRFGDPETQAILPRMKSDLLELILASVDGDLKDREIEWHDLKCICTVVASEGYPESSSKGDVITGLEKIQDRKGVEVFHAGTKKTDGKITTNGGRVLSFVSTGRDFREARNKVYEAISDIYFKGMQFRKDIAMKVVKDDER